MPNVSGGASSNVKGAVAPWEVEVSVGARAVDDGLIANGEDPRTLSNRSGGQAVGSRSTRHMLMNFLGLQSQNGAYTLLPTGLEQREDWQQACTYQAIDPSQSVYSSYWDLIVAVAILVTCFWTPYEVVFVPATFQRDSLIIFVLDITLTLIFAKDIFVQMITGYTEERDGTTVLVLAPWKIAANYLLGRFLLDVIAITPFDTVAIQLGKEAELEFLHTLRLLRLARITRFGRDMKKLQHKLGLSYGAMSLVKFGIFSIVCCHWMSCIWGFLAMHPLGAHEGHTWVTAVALRNGVDASSISDPHHIYVMGLYWALMTLTSLGYGDITAVNVAEYHVCIMFFVISGVSWAYIIGAICRIIGNMDPLAAQFQSNMDLLNIMMEDYDLDPEMRRRLRDYFDATRCIQRKTNQQSIIEALSPGLQGELAVLLTQRWISRIWYFDTTDSVSLTEISQRLVPAVFSAGEKLVLRSTFSSSQSALFVIVRGVAGDGGKVHIKNSVIGDDLIISNPILRRSDTAVAVTVVEVMYLKSEHLDEIRSLCVPIDKRVRRAQVRWSVRRGFVLAAWRRAFDGHKYSEYFQKNTPSFASKEFLETWCDLPWAASVDPAVMDSKASCSPRQSVGSGGPSPRPHVVDRSQGKHATFLSSDSVETDGRQASKQARLIGLGKCQLQLPDTYGRAISGFRDEMMPLPGDAGSSSGDHSRDVQLLGTLGLILQTVRRIEVRLERVEKKVKSSVSHSRHFTDLLGRH